VAHGSQSSNRLVPAICTHQSCLPSTDPSEGYDLPEQLDLGSNEHLAVPFDGRQVEHQQLDILPCMDLVSGCAVKTLVDLVQGPPQQARTGWTAAGREHPCSYRISHSPRHHPQLLLTSKTATPCHGRIVPLRAKNPRILRNLSR
jgi:hypothetical protein